MGDTFQDTWEDLIPREWRGYVFVEVDNTKWEGNFYYYRYRVHDNFFLQAIVQSTSPARPRLMPDIEVYHELYGVRVRLHFDFDWKNMKPEDPDPYFSSFEEALDRAVTKCNEFLVVLEPVFEFVRKGDGRYTFRPKW